MNARRARRVTTNVFVLKQHKNIITRVILGAMGCTDACRCMGLDPKNSVRNLRQFIDRIKNRKQQWPPFDDSSTSTALESSLDGGVSGESENMSDDSGIVPECGSLQASTHGEEDTVIE